MPIVTARFAPPRGQVALIVIRLNYLKAQKMPSLNKAQKLLLAAAGIAILWIQFLKFSDYGLEGTGWVIALLVATLLILPSLTLLPTRKNGAANAPSKSVVSDVPGTQNSKASSVEGSRRTPTVDVDAPELKEFALAVRRLSPAYSESYVLACGHNLLRKHGNPYIAALEANETSLKATIRHGGLDPATVGSLLGYSSDAICKFVIEEKVPHEIGEKYFDLLMAHMNSYAPPGQQHTGAPTFEPMPFDRMLELFKSTRLSK